MDGKAGQSGNEERTYFFLNLLDIVFPVTLQALLSFLGESEGREGEESLISGSWLLESMTLGLLKRRGTREMKGLYVEKTVIQACSEGTDLAQILQKDEKSRISPHKPR